MNRKTSIVMLLLALLIGAVGPRSSAGLALASGSGPAAPAAAAGGFSYQGLLKTAAGSPVSATCAFQFSLFSAPSGGVQLGNTQTVSGVSVSGGLFNVTLDDAAQFGANAFDGEARWLKIAVKCGGDPGFTALTPRQPLNPAPYALSLPGLAIQPNAISPNIVGGFISNTVMSGVSGATISGGGQFNNPFQDINRVTDDFGTVGGGANNLAGDADSSSLNAEDATVGGGISNQAGAFAATVAGGVANFAGGQMAAVGGGDANLATGKFATVPGGELNSATMTYTLAAGRGAKAVHQGTFVWADSAPSTFTSTGNDQFLIRATGGVGIGTNDPVNPLHVVGSLGFTATPSTTVVQFENTAPNGPDILALRASHVLTPGSDTNFITFFGSNSVTSLGSIQGNGAGGVELAGIGNDFAEFLPKQAAGETLAAGDIVGVHAGLLSHQTTGADQVLVISTAPIVAGNAPGAGPRDGLALAALIGQAEVRMRGAVVAGSFILPSGENDGVGLAVAATDLTPAQAAQIVGQALESADGAGVHTIRVAVGLPRDQVWAGLMQRQAQPAAIPGGLLPWLLFGGLLLFNLGALAGRRWPARQYGRRSSAGAQAA